MTVEFWKSFFDIGTLVLLFLTFAFGVGVLITGKIINKRQAEQIRIFETTLATAQTGLATEQRKTAEAQTEAAKAQLALKQFTEMLGKSVNPRLLNFKTFNDLLGSQLKGSADIWYEPDSEEAHFFAIQLSKALGSKGVGWVVKIKPFPTRGERGSEDGAQLFDVLRRTADLEGMAIAARDVQPSNAQLSALRNAIELGTGGWGISGLEEFFGDTALPERHFIIAIGPHQPNVPIVEFAHPKK